MSSLLAAKCCCGGGCDTGCECPGTATLPSTVLVSFTFTDCCGSSRSASVTVARVSPLTDLCPSCLACPIYSWRPEQTAGGCTTLCVADLIAWGCPNGIGGCTETDAMIGQVSIAANTCTYAPEGGCDQWVLTVTVRAKDATATAGPSKLTSTSFCECGWSIGCVVGADCFAGAWTVCKSDGTADPRGTYTSCIGKPTEFCDYTAAACPTGPDAPAPVVVVS